MIAIRVLACCAVLLFASVAVADDAMNAKALREQGVELYRQKNYKEAIAALGKSYELDPQPDTLFTLAQAERLGGRCDDAVVHYNLLLETTTDLMMAGAVHNNIGLCVTKKEDTTKRCEVTETAAVVRETPPRRSRLALGLMTGGALMFGGSIGLLIAASHSQTASTRADTYEDYTRLSERAGLERGLGYGALTLAIAGVGLGTYIWLKAPSPTTISASASANGGTVWLRHTW